MTYKILPSDVAQVLKTGWLAERGEKFQNAALKMAVLRTFSDGEMLYHYGDHAEGLYAIVTGSVRVAAPADDGQEFTAHRGGIGFWIGDLAMLSDQTRLISVQAVGDVRTLMLKNSEILELVRKTPEFYKDFYALTHNNMKTALRIMANLAVQRADQRLALRLLHLAETAHDHEGWIKASQEEISSMIAASLPTLQRILRRFSDNGYVEIGYGRIRVKDRKALLALCQS